MNYLGNRGEKYIQSLFENCGITCEKMPGNHIEYDFKCKLGKKNFTAEVKYDWLAQKTGNIAIEFHNTKKDSPSGINATTADVWITLIEDGNNITAWLTKTSELKNYFEKKDGRIVHGGDDNSSMKLFRQEEIFSISKRIDNLGSVNEILKEIRRILK